MLSIFSNSLSYSHFFDTAESKKMCEDSNNNNGVIHYIGEPALLVIHGVIRQCPFNTGGKHSRSNLNLCCIPCIASTGYNAYSK
jgi:hypothetical protein